MHRALPGSLIGAVALGAAVTLVVFVVRSLLPAPLAVGGLVVIPAVALCGGASRWESGTRKLTRGAASGAW